MACRDHAGARYLELAPPGQPPGAKGTVARTGRDTAAASCSGGRRLRAEYLRGVPASIRALDRADPEQSIAAVQDVCAVPARSHPAAHHG